MRFTQYFEQPARDSGQRRRERGPLLHSEVQPALRSWEPHSAVSDTLCRFVLEDVLLPEAK